MRSLVMSLPRPHCVTTGFMRKTTGGSSSICSHSKGRLLAVDVEALGVAARGVEEAARDLGRQRRIAAQLVDGGFNREWITHIVRAIRVA